MDAKTSKSKKVVKKFSWPLFYPLVFFGILLNTSAVIQFILKFQQIETLANKCASDART